MVLPSRTARGAKIDLTSHVFASYGDRFEVIGINDVSTDDISQYLDGVTAVIHTAAPLPSRGDAKFILKVGISSFSLLEAVLNFFFSHREPLKDPSILFGKHRKPA